MVRSLIGLLALAAPAAIFGAMQGCGDEPPPQDICNWLADSNNCYSRFSDDVGSQCGYPTTVVELANDPAASSTGQFLARDDLSQCIRDPAIGGGLITFEPPLDITTFPVTAVSVTIVDRKGGQCGSIAVNGPLSFGVTINPVDKEDAGVTTDPDGGPLSDDITGGAVSFGQPDGRERLDVTCAGGIENYNFNLLAPLDKCARYEPFLPEAHIDSFAGIPQLPTQNAVPGYVRLWIKYPPLDPNVPFDEQNPATHPRYVEYFNCRIPPPPPPCQDGVRNGFETDIDCGGMECAAKCAEGQGCNIATDCLSNNCGFNMGLQQCLP